MAEAFQSDAYYQALDGTTSTTTGLVCVPKGQNPGSTPTYEVVDNRNWDRLNTLLAVEAQGRIVREAIPGLTYGVTAINYTLGGAHKTYAGTTGQTFTHSNTNYVYLNASNALTVSTSSFPADITTFFPLAIVVCGASDVTSITDARGYARNVVVQQTNSGETGTDEESWIIDESNAGAANAAQLRFNRGSDDAEDAAIEWDESDTILRMRSKHSTGTLASIDCASVKIGDVSMLESGGAALVQSGVAGNGLQHSAGVLSVRTSSATGTAISGGVVAVDPSDGITLDANGVAVNLTSNGGLQLSGSAGSKTLGAKTDGSTTTLDGSGNIIVADAGLTGSKHANQSTSSGTPGTAAVIVRATLVGGNTVTIWNANAPYKARIIDAWSVATSADGGTWKVDNGTNDIIAAVTITGSDKAVNRAASIDDAYHEVASSGTLRVVGDGANADAIVYIMLEHVA